MYQTIRNSLNLEPLLATIKKSRRRWFGHKMRMPPQRLPKQAYQAKTGERPRSI